MNDDVVLVRRCPSCGSDRPLSEFNCENVVDGGKCLFSLDGEDVRRLGEPIGEAEDEPAPAFVCTQGHALEPGDLLCPVCGADRADEATNGGSEAGTDDPTEQDTRADTSGETAVPHVDGWHTLRAIPVSKEAPPWREFEVEGSGRRGLLTLYDPGHEPDPAVHDLLQRLSLEHVPEILATGRLGESAFTVTEWFDGGTLAGLGFSSEGPAALDRIVDELGQALAAFAEVGLRHRISVPKPYLFAPRNRSISSSQVSGRLGSAISTSRPSRRWR